MERTPVISSNIVSIGYDPGQRILEVEFLRGAVYQYFGVPSHVHQGLMNAPSHGKYFDLHVKKAEYPYKRVR